jgi:hypothetical protein
MTIGDKPGFHDIPSRSVELAMRRPHKSSLIVAGFASIALLAACSDSDREPGRFTVGGTVSGLADGGIVVLRNNGIDDLAVDGDGAFTFRTTLVDGEPYEVTVLNQPAAPRQNCLVTKGAGLLPGRNVTEVGIDCFPAVVLQATPGNDRILVSWNAGDFTATTFALCQAEAPIDGGVANRAAHDGGERDQPVRDRAARV